ncbi:hypothetical protein TB1_042332 [Malus domestica]
MEDLTENYSRLNLALSVMHECFEPSQDPYTKIDIVEDIIFNRELDLSRLNFRRPTLRHKQPYRSGEVSNAVATSTVTQAEDKNGASEFRPRIGERCLR